MRRYKAAGATVTDETGAPDNVEFLNISKDDAFAWPITVHRTYPSTVSSRMDAVVRPFIGKALEINHLLIDVLNDRLGLPTGTLAAFHKAEEHSGCISRIIRAPPRSYAGNSEEKPFLTAHTDYGSLVGPSCSGERVKSSLDLRCPVAAA